MELRGGRSDCRPRPVDIRITYATGNINVSGSGNGAGVLLVDGSIAMSNKSKFVGLVMVRDTVKLTGGGTGLHIYGSLMMGKTSDFLFSFTGNSKIRYSSVALAKAFGLLGQSYLVLYTNDLH